MASQPPEAESDSPCHESMNATTEEEKVDGEHHHDATAAASSLAPQAQAAVVVRDVKEFPPPDDALWQNPHNYPALCIPVQRTAELRKRLRHVVLRRPKTKNVYEDPDRPQTHRILVLQNPPSDNDEDDQGGSAAGPSSKRRMETGGETDQVEGTTTTPPDTTTSPDHVESSVWDDAQVQALLQEEDCQKTHYTIHMTYEDYTVEQVLKKLLPMAQVPTAFEMVGHIAHVNLRDEWLPYQYWIGKAVWDKHQPRIRTVVNKLGTIESEYRTFGMQVIAGDGQDPNWSVVTVKEGGCTFELDFRLVYWNSRLAHEHERLVRMIQKEAAKRGEDVVVADLMAGVGPFAVPLTATAQRHKRPNFAAVQNIRVYANDLNPASYKYLQRNARQNKCRHLECSNQDGRAVIHRLQHEGIAIDHVIMNLPASAPEFLDAFRGYRRPETTAAALPRIHVHCFAPKADQVDDYQSAVDRCSVALFGNSGGQLDRPRDQVRIHVVRDVSPQKNMLCVSFTLPAQVQELEPIQLEEATALASTESSSGVQDETPEEPQSKRPKTA